MFDLSIEKLLILAVVALFVLGPERLPAAATWLARTLREIKNYANDANQKIRSEVGPEVDEIRAPLDDLRRDLAGVRTWRDPRSALINHLRDDPIKPNHYAPPPGGWRPTPHQQPASRHGRSPSENAHPSTSTRPKPDLSPALLSRAQSRMTVRSRAGRVSGSQ